LAAAAPALALAHAIRATNIAKHQPRGAPNCGLVSDKQADALAAYDAAYAAGLAAERAKVDAERTRTEKAIAAFASLAIASGLNPMPRLARSSLTGPADNLINGIGAITVFIEGGERMRKAYHRRATFCVAIVVVAIIWPATTNAAEISGIIKRISNVADTVVKAAQKPNAKLSIVLNKAATLSSIIAALDTAIEHEPNEAADHMESLRQIAQDEINLGMTLMSSASMEDSDENAAVTIEHIGALADSIRESALAY
jgi:hypothetical protein